MHVAPLIGCPECDLLQRETTLPPNGAACCRRCGITLYRNSTDSLERLLALTLGAIVLFVIANSFPIAGLNVRGQYTETTLLGAVRALYDQDMTAVAALVFVTTIFAPAIELGARCYMLLPLWLGEVPRQLTLAFRLVPVAQTWGLIDVFMLGVVVSLVRLGHLATVVPGAALWSFIFLILLLTAIDTSFDPRAIWLRADANRIARGQPGVAAAVSPFKAGK